MKFFLAFLVAAFLPCLLAANWCGLASCQGRRHVDCDVLPNNAFGTACPDSAVMLNLEPAKSIILDRVNTLRNNIAGGRVANKFAAVRMGTVQWNVTLANLARKNVKKCTNTQDACMNTPDYDFVGQNIAQSRLPLNDTSTNMQRILALIDLWFSENTAATMADIRKFPQPTADGVKISNFSQLVRDYMTRMGCAALSYTDATNKTILFTCDFNLTNVVGWPVYVDGPSGRNCTTGMNPNYRNLCSTSEVYNVNKFWEDLKVQPVQQ